MTRAQMLLVFAGVGVIAIVAGVVTSLVIVSRGHDDTSRALQATADSRATKAASSRASETALLAQRLGTPIPAESLRSVSLMFCEPLHRDGQSSGRSTSVAVVPDGTVVYYKPGTCEPDLDANGDVATATGKGKERQEVKDENGNVIRVKPTYLPASNLFSAVFEVIVWTPAKGDLNGTPTVMAGRYLKPNAQVAFDSLGSPLLTFNMTEDGQRVFGSMSQRLIGMPLATFLDGEPLRGEHGQIVAPTIQSKITDSGQTTGLSLDDAKRIAALINNGLAQ